MKTILIAHNYTQQTVAAMSYNLAHYLGSNNYRVIFISHKPFFDKPFLDDKVMVYSWPTTGRPTGFKDAIWFAKLYLKYKPSVVISHFGSVNITVLVAKLFSFGSVKTLSYYHTVSGALAIDNNRKTLLSKLKKIRKYFIYKLFCDQIICPSELSKLDLADYFKINKGIKVVNPMNDRFQMVKESNTNEILLSYLGRIDKSKGVFLLVEAFGFYCRQNANTRIKLQIAGDGSEVIEFLEIIKSNDKVSYIGGLTYDKVDDFLRKGTYTIIPSFSDNLPTVGLESLMNGIPLLISKNTGLTHELEEAVNCITFTPKRNELIQLFCDLEDGKYNDKKLKENARKIYLEKFGVLSYCEAIVRVIEN